MHVMIDLETLSIRPDAAIVQIGAVFFEAKSGGKILNGVHQTFNQYTKVQEGAGSIDHSTLAWWLGQSQAAQEQLSTGMGELAAPLQEALEGLTEWLDGIPEGQIEGIWSNGAAFDQPILASAYAKFGAGTPWAFRVSRCCRTLFDLVGGPPTVDWTGLTSHNALDDALGQAMQVQKALGLLQREL